MYKALFLPHINYGISIWGNGKGFQYIDKLQKLALRSVLNLKYNVSPYFAKYNILKFEDMRDSTILTTMREYIHDELPQAYYSNNLFQYHPVKNCIPHQFNLPSPTTPYNKLLLYSYPKLWNSIKFERNDLGTTKQNFRKRLKLKYLSSYETSSTKKKCYV